MDLLNECSMLQNFVQLAPYIPMFIDEPVSVAITNREAFIYNQPCAEIPVTCVLGKPFPEDATPLIVIQSEKMMVREVSEKVYGVPFMSYAIPIKQDGEVVGCLMLAKSITKVKHVRQTISNLSENIVQISDKVNGITEEVQESTNSNNEVLGLMNQLLSETERINHILELINKLSNSTKILGLNAAIEAARAGEAGKGFAVVAKEIERLSNNTNQAANEIGEMLNNIEDRLGDISNRTQQTTDTFMGQAVSLEKISKTINKLTEDIKVFEMYVQQL